jgi:hypothetical protein
MNRATLSDLSKALALRLSAHEQSGFIIDRRIGKQTFAHCRQGPHFALSGNMK